MTTAKIGSFVPLFLTPTRALRRFLLPHLVPADVIQEDTTTGVNNNNNSNNHPPFDSVPGPKLSLLSEKR